MAGNQALDINQPLSGGVTIYTHGSDWLWAAFSLFLLSDLAVAAWMFVRPRGQRTLHLMAVIALTVASIAYYSMASDLGWTPVQFEFSGDHHQDYAGVPAERAIWYVRYILWVLTLPIILSTLLVSSGIPVAEIFGISFLGVTAAVSGLVGALVPSTYKWGYFTFGVAALLGVVTMLVGPARTSAGVVGADIRSIFTRGAAYLSFLYLIYPIAWGLADGGNVITSDGEMIFYGVLDILTIPVFLVAHLFQLRSVDFARFGHSFQPIRGTTDPEKASTPVAPLTGTAV